MFNDELPWSIDWDLWICSSDAGLKISFVDVPGPGRIQEIEPEPVELLTQFPFRCAHQQLELQAVEESREGLEGRACRLESEGYGGCGD